MIAVTLAWGARYRAHVSAWRESVKAFGLFPFALEMEGEPELLGKVWPLRPALVAQALEDHNVPVLLLDVDARIRQAPAWPEFCDLAAYSSRPGSLEPGVSLWRPGGAALRTLAAWRDNLDAGKTDDIALALAARDHGARVELLPPELCWRNGWGMEDRFGRRQPVIEVQVALEGAGKAGSCVG